MASDFHTLECRFRPIGSIGVPEIVRMHEVFARYYDNVDLEVFLRDMGRKTGVFVVTAGGRGERRIVGFSTVTQLDVAIDGRSARGIFSGDTIIEREYWGSRVLQKAFVSYLVRQRLLHPLTPLYWFLISKGYKTYLLLANNFPRYWPNPDGNHPQLGRVVDTYCHHLFAPYFDAQARLLDFGEGYQRLKGDVGGISEEMRGRFRNIAYFEQCNPSWRRGTELPCVGELALSDFWRFFVSSSWRKMRFARRRATPVQVQYE